MTAVDIARHLKIPQVIVPLYPGITSALGLLTTDLKYDFMRTEFRLSSEIRLNELRRDIDDLESAAHEQLQRDGVPDDRTRFLRSLDLRYLGQGYELRIAIPPGPVDEETLAAVWADFHKRHLSEYGHHFPENPIEVVNLRVIGIGVMPSLTPSHFGNQHRHLEEAWLKSAETHFRVEGSLRKLRTEFFQRSRIPVGASIMGPAVIFQKDSTTVLPPGSRAAVDEFGNILIDPLEEN